MKYEVLLWLMLSFIASQAHDFENYYPPGNSDFKDEYTMFILKSFFGFLDIEGRKGRNSTLQRSRRSQGSLGKIFILFALVFMGLGPNVWMNFPML